MQDLTNRTVKIDFLFLDLSVCTRCQDTETSLDDSLKNVSELLQQLDYKVQLNLFHIETEAQAIQHQFLSSPTIRVNGQDIQLDIREDHCSTCSSLTDGASVDCRIWTYQGKEYSVPPKALIIDAVMGQIYGTAKKIQVRVDYSLSKNLKAYFDNKDELCAGVAKTKEKQTCGDSSCCS